MMKDKRGFTLIEVIVTITILGIVTVIALPAIGVTQDAVYKYKLETYKQTIETATNLYVEAKYVDIFGNLDTGCEDISYQDLVDGKFLQDIDMSDFDIDKGRIVIRVKKINDNYDVECFFLDEDEDLEDVTTEKCEGVDLSGPQISITPNGSGTLTKSQKVSIDIFDKYGINANAKIKYKWVYSTNHSKIIGSEKTYDFKNNVKSSVSLKLDAPSGVEGKLALIVTPVDVVNVMGQQTNDVVVSNDFNIDDMPPSIVTKIYEINSDGSNGSLLKNVKNADAKYESWKKYGIYLDFSSSSDLNGVTKQVWKWNSSGNVKMGINYKGGSTTNNTVTNKSFTSSGARYGTVQMCDPINNCRSVDVQVYVSPKYYIKYDSGTGTGTMSNTTCYYEFDCTLSNNSFTKTGYHFENWKIGNKTYKASSKVKNLSSKDGETLKATAQWEGNNYYINYDDGNGNPSKHVTTCTYGKPCNLDIGDDEIHKDGYDLTGWKIGNDPHIYKKGEPVKDLTPTDNGSLIATPCWEIKKYKINYNCNGGSGCPGSQQKTHGQDITLSYTSPSRGDWKFLGWGTQSNSTKPSYAPGNTYKDNSSITLYAIWEKTVTVNFYPNKCGWSSTKVKTCSYYNAQTSCEIIAPNIDEIQGVTKAGRSYTSFLRYVGWNTEAGSTWSSFGQGERRNFSNNADYNAIVLLKDYHRDWRVNTNEQGLHARNDGYWGSSNGTLTQNSTCYHDGDTNWQYSPDVENPLWIYITQTSGKCYRNQTQLVDMSNCRGWSSARYLD